MRTLFHVALGIIVLLSATQAVAEDRSKEEKLRQLDMEIQELEGKKKTGIILVVGGIGVEVLSFAVFTPSTTITCSSTSGCKTKEEGNATVFWVGLIGGATVSIIGSYKWWDAAQQLGHLKSKRYDISLAPVPMFAGNGYGGGLMVQIRE